MIAYPGALVDHLGNREISIVSVLVGLLSVPPIAIRYIVAVSVEHVSVIVALCPSLVGDICHCVSSPAIADLGYRVLIRPPSSRAS